MTAVDAGLRINATSAVIQAAVAGRGLALVRGALVTQDIAEGRLVRLFPEMTWPIEWAYYAVASRRALARTPVTAFRDWLVESWAGRSG